MAARPHVASLPHRVHRNEVDMTVPVSGYANQIRRVLVRIVDVLHQAVLKGDPSAGLLKICITGRQHLLELISVGHRHEALSLFLGARVE